MNSEKKRILTVIGIVIIAFFICLPPMMKFLYNYETKLKAIENEYSYGIQKEVEDTCRHMIVAYTQDAMMYEQYKNTNSEWAAQAKIRANSTAVQYNEYVLKNSRVWNGNIPVDIHERLEYIVD